MLRYSIFLVDRFGCILAAAPTKHYYAVSCRPFTRLLDWPVWQSGEDRTVQSLPSYPNEPMH